MKRVIFLAILFMATSSYAAVQQKIEDITPADSIDSQGGVIKHQKTIKIIKYDVPEKAGDPYAPYSEEVLTKERYDEIIAQNNAIIAQKQAENTELQKLASNFEPNVEPK